MNHIIESILSHRSIRSYLSDEISQDFIEIIIKSSLAAPTSNNGQHVSIILVRDKDKKAKISELSGNQPWIKEAPVFLVYCLDFYRAKLASEKNKVNFNIINDLEATIIGSIDVGLAMQNAITAAESLGLGVVPIGGIRSNPSEIIKLLNLPEYVFPLCGLCVGYIANLSNIKPRLPLEAVLHYEMYNHQQMPLIDQYDEIISKYMEQRTHGKSHRNWSKMISENYKELNTRNIKIDMKKQGFKND